MALPTIGVKDAANVTQTINTLPNAGADVAANSLPVGLATDQLGAGGTGITQPTGGSGLLGWLSGIYSKIAATLTVSAPALATTSGSVTSATTLFTLTLTNQPAVNVQVTSAGSSNTITYEGTVDGTTWTPVMGINGGSVSAAPLTTSNAAGLYRFNTSGLAGFRARVSTYGSGTVAATAATSFTQGPDALQSVALQSGALVSLNSSSNPLGALGTTSNPQGAPSTPFRLVSSLATDNESAVKLSSGRLYSVTGYNAAATKRYLKFYNKASAATSGDTPLLCFTLPPLAPFAFSMADIGWYFGLGLRFRIVNGLADTDATLPTAADIENLMIIFS